MHSAALANRAHAPSHAPKKELSMMQLRSQQSFVEMRWRCSKGGCVSCLCSAFAIEFEPKQHDPWAVRTGRVCLCLP